MRFKRILFCGALALASVMSLSLNVDAAETVYLNQDFTHEDGAELGTPGKGNPYNVYTAYNSKGNPNSNTYKLVNYENEDFPIY